MARLSQLLLSTFATLFLLVSLVGIGTVSAAEKSVAAERRSTRPAGAPTLTQFGRTDAWRAEALRGVSQPHPAGLKFLDSQGAWYTPFDRPGVPDRYDLRGLHDAADFGVKKR